MKLKIILIFDRLLFILIFVWFISFYRMKTDILEKIAETSDYMPENAIKTDISEEKIAETSDLPLRIFVFTTSIKVTYPQLIKVGVSCAMTLTDQA